MTRTMSDMAAEVGATTEQVRQYLRFCGYTPDNAEPLWAEEIQLIRDHWADPTPQHQYQVTEGGRTWDQDKRDEHDGSL